MDKKIFLSKPELLAVGCKNCIWKLHDQCPHGLVGDQKLDEGYCGELSEWLFSLAGPGGDSSVLWERYHLFVHQLQAHDDYAEFKRLDAEYKRLVVEGGSDVKLLRQLDVERNTLKLWWARLNEAVLKSIGKTADRVARKEEVQVSGRISVQQLNVLMKESKEFLESSPKKDNG